MNINSIIFSTKKEKKMDTSQVEGCKGTRAAWHKPFSFILALTVTMWVVYRGIAKYSIKGFVKFAKLCYILNNKESLRAFYAMVQIASVISAEIVFKAVSTFYK